MKQLSKILSLCLLSSVSLFIGCGKDGATGPVGPQGPQGPQGYNGSANVQSINLTATNASWSLYSTPINEMEATWSVPQITSSVFNYGTVQMFISTDGTGNYWTAMPYSNLASQWNYTFNAGNVIVDYSLNNNTIPSNPNTQLFKLVVIPPAMVKPNVNVHNYESLKQAYNLKD